VSIIVVYGKIIIAVITVGDVATVIIIGIRMMIVIVDNVCIGSIV
jgi:hypothetical protein